MSKQKRYQQPDQSPTENLPTLEEIMADLERESVEESTQSTQPASTQQSPDSTPNSAAIADAVAAEVDKQMVEQSQKKTKRKFSLFSMFRSKKKTIPEPDDFMDLPGLSKDPDMSVTQELILHPKPARTDPPPMDATQIMPSIPKSSAEPKSIPSYPQEESIAQPIPAEPLFEPIETIESSEPPEQPIEQPLSFEQPVASQPIEQPLPPEQPITSQPIEQSLPPEQPVEQPLPPEQPVEQPLPPEQPVVSQPIEQSLSPEQPVAFQPVEQPLPPEQPVVSQPIEQSLPPEQPVASQPVEQPLPPEQPVVSQSIEQPLSPEQPVASQPIAQSLPPEQTALSQSDAPKSTKDARPKKLRPLRTSDVKTARASDNTQALDGQQEQMKLLRQLHKPDKSEKTLAPDIIETPRQIEANQQPPFASENPSIPIAEQTTLAPPQEESPEPFDDLFLEEEKQEDKKKDSFFRRIFFKDRNQQPTDDIKPSVEDTEPTPIDDPVAAQQAAEMENMSFIERIQYRARMRRREQTRLRRENARRNGQTDTPLLTKMDLHMTIIRLVIAAVLLGIGVLLNQQPATLLLYLAAYATALFPFAFQTVKNMTKGARFDENLLVLIASLGAFLLGRQMEAGIVMILYDAGRTACAFISQSTYQTIQQQNAFPPEKASVVNMQGDERKVNPADVKPGDFILVRSGEQIPIDGLILRGSGVVDNTAIMGEGEPTPVEKGSKVLAGEFYEGSLLLLRAVAPFTDCVISRIRRLKDDAPEERARIETSVVQGSARFMPIMVTLAILLAVLPPLFHSNTSLANWTYRALSLLLICCPTALTLTVSLGFSGGAGRLAQRGVHIRGSDTIEKMSELRMLVFNKTGILTEGEFRVKEVKATKEFNQASCLALAAAAEQSSQHPIAKAIRAASPGIPPTKQTEFEEYPGRGVRTRIGNRNLLVGNRRLMISRGVKGVPDIAGTTVYISYEGDYAGAILLEDTVRPEAANTIEDLKTQGVLRTVVLTGDTEAPTQQTADSIGIDTIHAGLTPEEKASKMEFLLRTIPTDGTAGYVGGGVDDVEELQQADIGIIMGLNGTQNTTEAASMMIMTNDLSDLAEALRVCRRTHRIIVQSTALILLMKGLLAVLVLLGVASMWQAVATDVLLTVLSALNAARTLTIK